MKADKNTANITSCAGENNFQMVALAKNPDRIRTPGICAPFTRQTPGSKQIHAPTRLQPHQRARYYDNQTGEFISRDPLEYVDGMSLYQGYFVPGGIDPKGLFLVQKPDSCMGHQLRIGPCYQNENTKPAIAAVPFPHFDFMFGWDCIGNFHYCVVVHWSIRPAPLFPGAFAQCKAKAWAKFNVGKKDRQVVLDYVSPRWT